MRYSHLKWLRVALAVVVIFLTTFIFIDFRDFISEENVGRIVWIQFIPSLINFITVLSLSGLGFLLVILLTSLFGRVYCASFCPLGILQDLISRLSKILGLRKRYKYRKPALILRNGILVLVVISVFAGSIILVNILDPFSLFGKFANGILRPAGTSLNNFLTGILEARGVYCLYYIDYAPFKYGLLILPVITIIVLLILAGRYGRLYCNTICPVGTLLGWLSKFSLFRIEYNELNCTKCGKCASVCKSECLNIKELIIDHSSCVACFNCLKVCPDDAIDFRIRKKSENLPGEVGYNNSKRSFILSSLGGMAMLSGFSCRVPGKTESDFEPLNVNPTIIPEKKEFPVSPPGSLSLDHFTSLCTACQLCVSKCPTGVLQPSVIAYGLTGFMQPHLDFHANYCNYECTICSEVCPTGAIMALSSEAKLTTQIGRVELIIENCVVYTEDTACGACSEHCPTQAVRMVPYHQGLTIPEIDVSICVGCGACEYICPVRPYRAIYVDGNPIHEIAKTPETEPLEGGVLQDFPF